MLGLLRMDKLETVIEIGLLLCSCAIGMLLVDTESTGTAEIGRCGLWKCLVWDREGFGFGLGNKRPYKPCQQREGVPDQTRAQRTPYGWATNPRMRRVNSQRAILPKCGQSHGRAVL